MLRVLFIDARYGGLHRAAHDGDVFAIARLVAVRADVNARDAQGRTPLHVGTFARQRKAIRALARKREARHQPL